MALSHFTSPEGAARLVFARRGTTRLARLFQKAPLRVLMPRPAPGEPPCAVLLNTSGGIVGGDALQVEVHLEAGAAAVITSQAAEKAYRSAGADATLDVALELADGAWLEWLPQETILFDGARLRRRLRVDAAAQARLRSHGHAGLRAARAGRAVPERLPLRPLGGSHRAPAGLGGRTAPGAGARRAARCAFGFAGAGCGGDRSLRRARCRGSARLARDLATGRRCAAARPASGRCSSCAGWRPIPRPCACRAAILRALPARGRRLAGTGPGDLVIAWLAARRERALLLVKEDLDFARGRRRSVRPGRGRWSSPDPKAPWTRATFAGI